MDILVHGLFRSEAKGAETGSTSTARPGLMTGISFPGAHNTRIKAQPFPQASGAPEKTIAIYPPPKGLYSGWSFQN